MSVRNPENARDAEAMRVGEWSSAACGETGWPTEVVEFHNGMTQDQVDQLVQPLLQLGEGLSQTSHMLKVTLLPPSASTLITNKMVSLVPPGSLYTTQRVVIGSLQADPYVQSALPSLYPLTSSGCGPLLRLHDLAAFATAHFLMLAKEKQGLPEHFDNAAWQGPTAMIHLVKVASSIVDGRAGRTNFFYRDVHRRMHVVLRAEGGFVMSASAGLLHVVSHGVLPDPGSNQYTCMIRGPLRQNMRSEFHKLLVDSVLTATAIQTLQTVMNSMGVDVMLGGAGSGALAGVSQNTVAASAGRFSLVEGLAGNWGRRNATNARLPHVFVDLVGLDGTPFSASLGQAGTRNGQSALLFIMQAFKTLIGHKLCCDNPDSMCVVMCCISVHQLYPDCICLQQR
jgi:hypothetical protein